ncbi:MAG: HAD-IA family hydrolase [Cyclobacteriaceae bacterium]|nr:HAD-IA family hydrolase [Cyclobacteriaceae bacterium]
MKILVDPRAKGLIFDLDGTLVDSMPLHYEAWKEICLTINYDFTEKFFYDRAGVSADSIFAEIKEITGLDFDPHDMAIKKEVLYDSKTDRLSLVAPVMEVVELYHGKLPMAIGTGSPGPNSWEAVRKMGLDKYFEILVSKNDVPHPKPAPDTFLRAAELIGIEPSFIQVFEDGDPGIQAAKSAGMMVTDIRPYVKSR